MSSSKKNNIILFKGNTIRRTFHGGAWWFVINDVFKALTDSPNTPESLKNKGLEHITTLLLIDTASGTQKLNCASTDGIFDIIQYITSPKVKDFKSWLATEGYLYPEGFKYKTRKFYRKISAPFHRNKNFFDHEDILSLIHKVFNGKILVDADYFFEQLNGIIALVGTTYPDVNTRTPGKKDELALLKYVRDHNDKLQDGLNILLNEYGCDTFQHLYQQNAWPYKEILRTLEEMTHHCQVLHESLPHAIQSVENSKGKPPGNNTQQAINALILYLIPIYEKITGNLAQKHFKRGWRGEKSKFTGQFYDFIHHVFIKIRSKYNQLWIDQQKIYPFDLRLDDESHALGDHISKIFDAIKKKRLFRIRRILDLVLKLFLHLRYPDYIGPPRQDNF